MTAAGDITRICCSAASRFGGQFVVGLMRSKVLGYTGHGFSHGMYFTVKSSMVKFGVRSATCFGFLISIPFPSFPSEVARECPSRTQAQQRGSRTELCLFAFADRFCATVRSRKMSLSLRLPAVHAVSLCACVCGFANVFARVHEILFCVSKHG